jgi:hypothetical protein
MGGHASHRHILQTLLEPKVATTIPFGQTAVAMLRIQTALVENIGWNGQEM